MGSECSVEKDYELDEPVECNSKEWSIYTARRSQDGLKVTVFVHEKKEKEKNRDYERISKAAQVRQIILGNESRHVTSALEVLPEKKTFVNDVRPLKV